MKIPTKNPYLPSTLFEAIILGVFAIVLLGIISAPIMGAIRTHQTASLLNKYCKMDVGFWEVATNGDQLVQICAAKNKDINLNLLPTQQ